MNMVDEINKVMIEYMVITKFRIKPTYLYLDQNRYKELKVGIYRLYNPLYKNNNKVSEETYNGMVIIQVLSDDHINCG